MKILVAAAIIMQIPLVDEVEEAFYRLVENGGRVAVDADNQTVTLEG